jgi:hypothetical protein
MTAWLKTFREGNTASPRHDSADVPPLGTNMTFLDPPSATVAGVPKVRADGLPYGEPGYAPGDLLGLYWGGSGQVTEVWEVIASQPPLPQKGGHGRHPWSSARTRPMSPLPISVSRAARSPDGFGFA